MRHRNYKKGNSLPLKPLKNQELKIYCMTGIWNMQGQSFKPLQHHLLKNSKSTNSERKNHIKS